MSFVRTFEDFSPPRRMDSMPFVTVEIQEAATAVGPFVAIDTQPLIPTDPDPAEPISRDFTTALAQLDPAWYVLVWTDGAGNFFPSEPISSLRRAFVSIQDLGRALGRNLTDNDAALDAIDDACDIVRTFTEQEISFVAAETITLDGQGTDVLILPECPVVEVSSVLENDEEVTDFTLHDDGTLLRALPWCVGRNNIEVTYSHGWATTPPAIHRVALNIAQRLFQFGELGGGDIQSETIGSYSVSYQATGTLGDLTKTEERMLRKFKRKKQPWATLAAAS